MSQTVRRAISILEACSEQPRTVQQIAEVLQTHRTTALRLVQTLEDAGFLRRVDAGRYGVGFRLAGLATRAIEQFDLRAIVHPHLQDLSDAVGFTVQFAVPQKNRLIYVDKIEPPSSISLPTRIGGEVVVNTAGVAKSILAFLDPAQRDEIIDHAAFAPYTPRTITSRDRYRAVLGTVRERGWATDDGEYEEFSNCVAAPVFDWSGDVVGALSITAFTHHADLDALRALLPDMLRTTRAISHDLGAAPSAAPDAASDDAASDGAEPAPEPVPKVTSAR